MTEKDRVDSKTKDDNGDEVYHTSDGKTIIVKRPSKKNDGLTMGKLVVSGAAAITASIITTRLAGTVNGLLIVGVSSVVVAVLNEVYRKVLSKMKKLGAKAVVSMPLDKMLPDTFAVKVNNDLQSVLEDTDTIPVISDVHGHDDRKNHEPGTPNEIEVIDDSGDGTELKQDGHLRSIVHDMGVLKGLRVWCGLQWRSWSWLTKSMIVVLGVVLLSAGVSLTMSRVFDQPEINVTNVTRHDVKDLSDAEKEAIKNAAVRAVSDRLQELSDAQSDIGRRISDVETKLGMYSNTGQPSPSPSPSSSSTNPSTNKEDVKQMQQDITALHESVNALQKRVNELNNGDGKDDDATEKQRIDDLSTRIDSLSSRIKALESLQSNNTQNTGNQNGG